MESFRHQAYNELLLTQGNRCQIKCEIKKMSDFASTTVRQRQIVFKPNILLTARKARRHRRAIKAVRNYEAKFQKIRKALRY